MKMEHNSPCMGTLDFEDCRRPPLSPITDATVALLLLIFEAADGILAVDLASSFDAFMPLLVRVGR